MTILEAYLILGLLFGGLGVTIVWVIWWMNRHSYLVQISYKEGGSFIQKGGRYRLLHKQAYILQGKHRRRPLSDKDLNKIRRDHENYTGQPMGTKALQAWLEQHYKEDIKSTFYPISDLFRRKPFAVPYEEIKDYFIMAESVPFIGIKHTLKLKIVDGAYYTWKPPEVDTTPDLSYILLTFTDKTRRELYESTKQIMSNAELVARIALPIGMVVLALGCLIFFPKIYAAVMADGNAAAKTALTGFQEQLNKFVPLG